MIDRLEAVLERYREIEREMASPAVLSDHVELANLAREQASIREVVQTYEAYRRAEAAVAEAREMLRREQDVQMQEFLRGEEAQQSARQRELEEQLKVLLLPRDRDDDRDVVVEIQAAAGGQEAALFAADLFRMYARWAQAKGWQVDVIDIQETGIGGFDKIEFEVRGRGAYSMLKYEGGPHRVQRVPETESQGRVHTSVATVVVAPEAEPVEVELEDKDLKVETSTSQGHGGQSVNTTYSKVILTHLPTGIVVACQDERSQLQNREKAFRVLRARLYEMKLAEQRESQGATRRSMVRSGDRSEKIRTYNFKENRVTDHRVPGLTLYHLDRIMAGELDEIVTALAAAERAEQLAGEPA